MSHHATITNRLHAVCKGRLIGVLILTCGGRTCRNLKMALTLCVLLALVSASLCASI